MLALLAFSQGLDDEHSRLVEGFEGSGFGAFGV